MVSRSILGGNVKFSRNHLSLILEYVILETRAARQWINKNVDPQDLTEGADLLIAYNSGITDINILSWIKKIRKIVPKNYRELRIPLSAGEVSREGIPLFEKSIEINFIVKAINEFRKPKHQAILKSNGYPTNLSTRTYSDILALVSVNAQVDSAIKAKEAAKRRKKSGDAGLNYDPTSVDFIGDFGPWTVLMPNTVEGSISCDMSTARTTTWCTTKSAGENLFNQYVGNISEDEDTILFYVMDYNRVPDNPKLQREKAATYNNDSRMSIGFRGGEPQLTGAHGSLSVDASNAGLTEKVVKDKLGIFYQPIMFAMTKKARIVGTNHPAKQIMRNAAQNLLVLKQIIKDYKPVSKRAFFTDLRNYYHNKPEAFSPQVVDYITFGVSYEEHRSLLPTYINKASVQEVAKYVDMVEKSNGSEPWIKHSAFEDSTEIVDADFNVVKNTLDYRKWTCLSDVLVNRGHNLPKDLLTKTYLLAREYFKEYIPKFREFLPPGLLPEEERKGYHSDQFIFQLLMDSGVPKEGIPDELAINLEKINELQSSEAYLDSVEEAIKDLNLTEFEQAPQHISKIVTTIAKVDSQQTEQSSRLADRFNVKEKFKDYFALQKEYDVRGTKFMDRIIPPELIFGVRVYNSIVNFRNPVRVHDLPEDIKTTDIHIADYDSIVDYLFELFPALKTLPLMEPDKLEPTLEDAGAIGVIKAVNFIGKLIAGSPKPETVRRVFDMSSGVFYQYLLYTTRNYSIPDDIYYDFFKKAKTNNLNPDRCDLFVRSLGDTLMFRIERKYAMRVGMTMPNFVRRLDIPPDEPEYKLREEVEEMMAQKNEAHKGTKPDRYIDV
mgnify:FL=1